MDDAKNEKQFLTIGTLFVGSNEFAVDADYIQEVINAPPTYSKMPLAPAYLAGLINLRGMILPVVDLGKLLNLETTGSPVSEKIVVICYGLARVGFLLSSIGEVLRIRRSDVCGFTYDGGITNNVVQGALKLDGGKRILQMLNPSAMVRIHNLPQINDLAVNGQVIEEHSKKARVQNKCIAFSVDGVQFALEITGIHEIVVPTDIDPPLSSSDLTAGIIRVRDQIVSTVNFSNLVGSNSDKRCQGERAPVIIVNIHGSFVGLTVDRLEGIVSYSSNEVLPVPILVQERSSMFVGAITHGDNALLLLNPLRIFTKEEVGGITSGHSRLYGSDNESDKRTRGKQESYISFDMSGLFGILTSQIQEIVKYPEDLVEAPGTPDFVQGMLNLRGDLIPIVNPRRLYNLDGDQAPDSKVLVIDYRDYKFGFVVDRVCSIVSVEEGQNMVLPPIIYSSLQESFDNDIERALEIDDGAPPLMTLSLDRILTRVRGGKCAPTVGRELSASPPSQV